VQLPQADPLDAKLAPAADRLLAQILGTAVGTQTSGPLRVSPPFVAIRLPP